MWESNPIRASGARLLTSMGCIVEPTLFRVPQWGQQPGDAARGPKRKSVVWGGGVGGAEAAARKWSGPWRAEGRPCFVRSAKGRVRPAGLGATGSSSSALRAVSPGWRPRPATLGPVLEALAARRLDWGVVSDRGPDWRGRVRGPCLWVQSCSVGCPGRPADPPFGAINSNIHSANVYGAPVCRPRC